MSDDTTTTTRKHVAIPEASFTAKRGPALAEPKSGAGRQASPVLAQMAALVDKSKRDTPYSVPCQTRNENGEFEPMTDEQVEAVSRYLRTAANQAGHGIRMELHPGEIRFVLRAKIEGRGRKPGSKNKSNGNGSE